MPHLRFRGCKLDELRNINMEMISILSEKLDTPKDYFTVEFIESYYVSEEKYPFIEVLWFNRGDETKQLVANIITDLMKQFKYTDVCVYFVDLEKKNYYENKEHF